MAGTLREVRESWRLRLVMIRDALVNYEGIKVQRGMVYRFQYKLWSIMCLFIYLIADLGPDAVRAISPVHILRLDLSFEKCLHLLTHGPRL